MEFKREIHGNTIYSTAEKFENLPVSKALLDVSVPLMPILSCTHNDLHRQQRSTRIR